MKKRTNPGGRSRSGASVRRKQGKTSGWVWVAGGAAALLVACLGLALAARNGGDKTNSPAVAENRTHPPPKDAEKPSDKQPPKASGEKPPRDRGKPPDRDKVRGSNLPTVPLTVPPEPLDVGGEPTVVADGQILPGNRAVVPGAVFSSDGKWMVASDNAGVLHVWDMVKLRRVFAWPGFGGVGYRLALTRDGEKLLCVNGGNALQLVDLKSGKNVRAFEKNTAFVFCIAVSADGKRGATGGGGNEVSLCAWKRASAWASGKDTPAGSPPWHSAPMAASLSPLGGTICACGTCPATRK